MDFDILAFQQLNERGVLVAGLVHMDGELLPGVFITGLGGGCFLAIDEEPLFLLEGAADKNLFDKKDADERAAQKQDPKLRLSHRRVIDFLYLDMDADLFQVGSYNSSREDCPVERTTQRQD